ncbi:MAG: FliM/FliN family flagellar motor switch protein [Candidatus Korobacteraceae bacterium]
MANPPAAKIEAFLEAWSGTLATLVSQLGAGTWSFSGAGPAEDYSPVAALRLKLTKGVHGCFWISVSPSDSALLLELFTGEKAEISGPLDASQSEALTELIRQWAGLAASELKPTFGEVAVEVISESSPPAGLMGGRLLNLTSGERRLSLRAEMDSELMDQFDRRQGSRAQIVPEANRASLDQLVREGNLDLLLDVELAVTLRFGSRRAPLREILELSPGAVLELNREIQEPVDLLLNDRVIARGDVVVVDGNYGLNITDVISPEQRLRNL